MKNIESLLDKLRAIEEAMTEGPWRYAQLEGFGATNFLLTDAPKHAWHNVVAVLENAGGFDGFAGIAAARNALPVLLAMLTEAQDALERMSVATSEPERFNAEANATLAKLDALAALDSATPPERADFLAACGRVGERMREARS